MNSDLLGVQGEEGPEQQHLTAPGESEEMEFQEGEESGRTNEFSSRQQVKDIMKTSYHSQSSILMEKRDHVNSLSNVAK